MKVVLVGLDNPNHRLGVTSVAEHLALRVDSIITLPTALIEACFTKVLAEQPRPTPPSSLPHRWPRRRNCAHRDHVHPTSHPVLPYKAGL
ncbi:hypothetical protein HWD94_12770 [Pseudarthrobacter equi]|uniref:hypothetical protein n=1 Tax=Pseudarthrobacter TaxID=1742993 RepID=UPI001584E63A|nr:MULTISPECIES: hypothetical protein [Pseudarthrobacter]MCT9625988.1 hypothetical protein [Pseudarthrobacter equi]NUT72159.1 hypothetical protein [Pseudarthrobacter sp. C4D7]